MIAAVRPLERAKILGPIALVDDRRGTRPVTADGHAGASADKLAYAVHVWLYADALGLAQGYTPPSS